ncbi:phage tail protein [Paenibacillus sp. LMG 31461]|uniref:Phage tail protein n=1 Tax=Paenibacillus plantarum TaxID=2654975 RepID=A0ABX1X4Y9_9BACL|nr:phage tail domain-containing protein [Paenibacillus plantarum]NOU63181.1 phage tail protein [Paenibacillus plantarum]
MITLDGYSLDYFGLIIQPGHEHAILPSTVDRTLAISGKHGLWDFGADLGPRSFSFPLAWAYELNRVTLQQRIRQFAAFLLNSSGRPRSIKLEFDYEPGIYYVVRLVGNLVPERVFSLAFFKLPLIAFEPFAFGQEHNSDITITSSPSTLTIVSSGNVKTEPTITLINTGVNTIHGLTLTNEYEVE